jgi:hypothetical protein
MKAKFVAVMRVELVGWMMILQGARMRVMVERPRPRAVWVAGSEKICPGKNYALKGCSAEADGALPLMPRTHA